MFIEAQVGVQSCHADVDAWFARDVIGVGFPETALVKNVFRQFDHIDVVSGCGDSWSGLNVVCGDLPHGDYLFSLSMVINVISGSAKTRIGGPQVPAPRLTYSLRPSASRVRPVCTP